MAFKKNGKPVAALIAGSLTVVAIGILHILAESVDSIHDWLEFFPRMGTLSGKVIVAYSLGIIFYFILSNFLKDKNPNIKFWTKIFILSLILASIFVFTPFVKLLVG